MLKGMLPIGTNMDNSIGVIEKNKTSLLGIDAVIFVISPNVLDDVQILKAMKPFYDETLNSSML